MLQGSLTLLVTPFRGADVDESAFESLVAWQAAEGADGLVTGTLAGEGPTLAPHERDRLVRMAVAAAGGLPVVAATGTNATATTIAATRAARAAGAAAALIVAPFYSRPTQEGLFRHFEAVARAVDLPIVIGNAPGRTAVEIEPATLERLLAIPAFVGLADETTDAYRRAANALIAGGRAVRLAAGEFAAEIPGLPPAEGCLSLAANVAPGLCAAFLRARAVTDPHGLPLIGDRLLTLCRALDGDPEPAAAKYAVSLLRPAIDPTPRLPIVPVTAATAARLRCAIAGLTALPLHEGEAARRDARQMDRIVRGP
ncbi:dihydrodipicolinate synthase family protein [Labrys wisconsinensis]|uniref:4-hydroxy-tetrahydrodipicolinate synthase n=1 Tax=Labrys wisconsinensis TaxID=425677 RepID=A0ABU0J9J5_9HYPH|nr:dihydrodipicolinate synthase family protein [Labrys wisconsinensis]MDQ0470951.1 4-hydroxy-tetrahydrodipicolinate synthase [Labrys wisconsinensis]